MTRDEAMATLEAIKQFGMGKWMFDKEEIKAFDMAIESLSAEPTDLISKEDAIAIAYRQCDGFITIEQGELLEGFEEEIRAFPSADRPSGEWICKDSADMSVYWFECSECGELPPRDNFNHEYKSNYCPNCGAEMRGETE